MGPVGGAGGRERPSQVPPAVRSRPESVRVEVEGRSACDEQTEDVVASGRGKLCHAAVVVGRVRNSSRLAARMLARAGTGGAGQPGSVMG